MKYYRELKKDEDTLVEGDVLIGGTRISKISGSLGCPVKYDNIFYRPVELRDPDELTDEEIEDIWETVFDCRWPENHQTIKERREYIGEVSVKIDEIRTRPRETEKEKWIREKLQSSPFDYDTHVENMLNEAWDKATEVGRRKHGE